MEKVGVMAVVESLSKFNSDMKSIDKTIRGLIPGANLVQAAFQKLGSFFSGIFTSAVRIVEYALGNLLAGAIRNVIQGIKDLIGSVIEAGKNFQTLSIRLNRLNFNEISKTVDNYTEAMDQAKEATQENLKWLQKLAVMSPYDADDVALVFTMARSYGFAGKEAQQLTNDTLDFAAGMGLTADHMKRIIYNFGQMEAAQKVTGRELRDLANSFVPVNDILLVMQERTGLTGDAFDDFRNSAEGVDMFLEEFSKLVASNYAGAASDLARTFEFATQNTKDLVQSLLGLNVVKPVLDTLGANIADFIDALTSGGRFEVLQTLFGRIGDSISNIIQGVLDLGPSTDDMVTGILKGVLNLADWLESHEDDIIGFFQGIATKIKDDVIPWIKDKLIPAIQDFIDRFSGAGGSDFFERLKDAVLEMAPPLANVAEAVAGIIETIQRNPEAVIGVVEGIAGAFQTVSDAVTLAAPHIEKIITWLSENQETVAAFVQGFLILQIVWGALITVLGVLVPILTTLGIIIGIVAAIATSAAFPFIAIGIIVVALAALIVKNWDKIKNWTKKTWNTVENWTNKTWDGIWDKITTIAQGIWESLSETWASIVEDVKARWAEFAEATETEWENVKQSVKNGVQNIMSIMTKFVSDFAQKGQKAGVQFLINIINSLSNVAPSLVGIVKDILAVLNPLLNLNININVSGGGGGGGGGACFVAGTNILKADGHTINIENAVKGTEVMCWDGDNALRKTTVTELIVHESEVRTILMVKFVSGTYIIVTPNHIVRSNGQWVAVGKLSIGDSVTNWRMEEDTITEVVPRTKDVPVYNLHVEDEQHNYIAEGHIVHNVKQQLDVGTSSTSYGDHYPTPVTTSNVNNTTNNFSVNFGSAANPEPILADFATLQSLV